MRLLPENIWEVRGRSYKSKGESVKEEKVCFFSEILSVSWNIWISLFVFQIYSISRRIPCFRFKFGKVRPPVRRKEEDTDVGSSLCGLPQPAVHSSTWSLLHIIPKPQSPQSFPELGSSMSTQPLRLTSRKDRILSFSFQYTCLPL